MGKISSRHTPSSLPASKPTLRSFQRPVSVCYFPHCFSCSSNIIIGKETLDMIKIAYPSGTHSTDAHQPDSPTPADHSDRDSEDEGSDPVARQPKFTNRPGKFKERALDDEDSEEGMSNLGSSDDEDGCDSGKGVRSRDPFMPEPSNLSSPSLKVIDRKGGDDDFGRVRLAGGKWISNYEYKVLLQRTQNRMLIASLNIPAAVRAVVGSPTGKQNTPRAPSQQRARILPSPRHLPARAAKSGMRS